MLAGKRIVLVIAGGIAAYKSLELIRRLRERGASVRAILTRGGAEFVTPLSVSALSENKVYQDLFSLTDESEMGHIRLSREADMVVVAPDSADLIAKIISPPAERVDIIKVLMEFLREKKADDMKIFVLVSRQPVCVFARLGLRIGGGLRSSVTNELFRL